ncbi:MAG: polysaccharide biosynthesis protein [Candidatus Doudnabacteria bacterium]|nr:polysaccharide biosynthesis protein [Candidatus Doudnabacteria bacterium]
MPHLLDNATVLITGGTGAWGKELTRQVLSKFNPKEVRIYSRGEHAQVEMRREFPDPRLKFIIGDVRDRNILTLAMKGVDYVFHLAALKHVPVCEDNSWEAVLTNIYGTQNVIEAAIQNQVKKVVDVSTDKAVEPYNFYGVTKACAEKLVINANQNYISKTIFMCIRGGNVIGTTGSVVPLFAHQIRKHNKITLTDPTMTRFLMSTKEAISLVFTAFEQALGGEVFVMKMPAANMETVADAMLKLKGNRRTKVGRIKVRPGEKMHEVLVSHNEAKMTYDLNNGYFVILPHYAGAELGRAYQKFPKLKQTEFSSQNTRQLDLAELVKALKKEQWLVDA